MTDDTVHKLLQPGEFSDQLTDILRAGAQKLLAQAIEVEVESFISAHQSERLDNGRARVVRHGTLPERRVQTGVGSVPVTMPRVRDRETTENQIRFQSSILPKYVRRTKSLEALIPWLYLKGISSGDMQEALSALLGSHAPRANRKSW